MLVAFSVTPLGTGEAVGEVVAEAVRVVRESGLPNQTDAMFTTIEGVLGRDSISYFGRTCYPQHGNRL